MPTKLTFDLATLDLSAGTYNVKVWPKGDGETYSDADLDDCNTVSYTVSGGGTVLSAPLSVEVDNSDFISMTSDLRTETYEAFMNGNSIGSASIERDTAPSINSSTLTTNFADITVSAYTDSVEGFIDGQSIGVQSI